MHGRRRPVVRLKRKRLHLQSYKAVARQRSACFPVSVSVIVCVSMKRCLEFMPAMDIYTGAIVAQGLHWDHPQTGFLFIVTHQSCPAFIA